MFFKVKVLNRIKQSLLNIHIKRNKIHEKQPTWCYSYFPYEISMPLHVHYMHSLNLKGFLKHHYRLNRKTDSCPCILFQMVTWMTGMHPLCSLLFSTSSRNQEPLLIHLNHALSFPTHPNHELVTWAWLPHDVLTLDTALRVRELTKDYNSSLIE